MHNGKTCKYAVVTILRGCNRITVAITCMTSCSKCIKIISHNNKDYCKINTNASNTVNVPNCSLELNHYYKHL